MIGDQMDKELKPKLIEKLPLPIAQIRWFMHLANGKTIVENIQRGTTCEKHIIKISTI